MDYTTTCDTIINYLIDKNIKYDKNDTTLIKIKYFLLKYKRIIAIVLLIILVCIGNQCNLSYLNLNVNHKKAYVLNGGANAIIETAATAVAEPIKDKRTFTEKTYDAGAKYANKFKDNSSVFYGFVYSIAITILMFLIFVPAVGFVVIGFICYSLLKTRMVAIKSL